MWYLERLAVCRYCPCSSVHSSVQITVFQRSTGTMQSYNVGWTRLVCSWVHWMDHPSLRPREDPLWQSLSYQRYSREHDLWSSLWGWLVYGVIKKCEHDQPSNGTRLSMCTTAVEYWQWTRLSTALQGLIGLKNVLSCVDIAFTVQWLLQVDVFVSFFFPNICQLEASIMFFVCKQSYSI